MPSETEKPHAAQDATPARTASVSDAVTRSDAQAAAATEAEHNRGFIANIKLYPKAVAWSLLLSTTIIMEGFDKTLITGLLVTPAFRRDFGVQLDDGSYTVTAAWEAGLTNGALVGEITGLFFTGIIADRFGFRKTMIGALALVTGFIGIVFSLQNLPQLLAGLFLCGIPWGVFQTLTGTYAAEVCPTNLRSYLTTYVNMCWVIGQFISPGVLKGVSERNDEWAYRIPFAIQWAWPLPLIIGIYLAPESPWWLVRKERYEDAKHVLRRLTSRNSPDFNEEDTVKMMIHTNEFEKSINEGTSYLDCFRCVNLRRTEIKAFVYAAGAITISLSSVGQKYSAIVPKRTRELIKKAAILRQGLFMGSRLTVLAITTNLFIHNCLFTLDDPASAFLYLRHAQSMVELLRVRESAVEHQPPSLEDLRLQRLYWILFIHERFAAVSEYHQLILRPIPVIPERDPNMPEGLHKYLIRLIKLFSLIDTTFLHGWLAQSDARDDTITASWIRQRSQDLLRDGDEAEVDREFLTSMQLADLTITRHWLLTHLWRIAMSRGLLDNLAADESFSLFFPVRMADQLRQEVQSYSFESIEINGICIAKKLFELTDTLADLVLYVPPTSTAEHVDRIDLLIFLLCLTFRSVTLDSRRKSVLQNKLQRIQSLESSEQVPVRESHSANGFRM